MKPMCTNLCHEQNIKIGWYTPSDGARWWSWWWKWLKVNIQVLQLGKEEREKQNGLKAKVFLIEPITVL